MDDRVDPETLSARVTPSGGRLLTPGRIAGAVARVGRQFTLRGVEATAAGTLEHRGADLVLRLPSGEALVLRPLERKVQWSARRKRVSAPAAEERGAFERLERDQSTLPIPLEVTGPVAQSASGEFSLEVREFRIGPPR